MSKKMEPEGQAGRRDFIKMVGVTDTARVFSIAASTADMEAPARAAGMSGPSDATPRFLRRALTELEILEREAPKHYHGVLCGLLAAARRETEMLLREETQAEAWPRSGEQARLLIK